MKTMGQLRTLWLVGTVLLVLAPSTEAAYYNEARVTLYTRLSQQLRYQLSDRLASLITRSTTLHAELNAKVNEINVMLDELHLALASSTAGIEAVAQQSNLYTTDCMKAYAEDPFPGLQTIQYNVRDLDHGFEYNVGNGDALFPKTGVYLMEMKNQGTYQKNVRTKFKIWTPTGSLRYNMYYFTDWEVSPYFEAFSVQKGDRLDTQTLSASGNVHYSIIGGVSNQIHFRYLGQA